MNENKPNPNLQQVKEDRKKIKSKGIKSPVLKDLPYFIYDKKHRAKFFFATKKKYKESYNRLFKTIDAEYLKVSHPKLLNIEK
jgi:hypothetical protein